MSDRGDADFLQARYSQSLQRGLAILSCFTPADPALGVAEIAERLGLSRSTAHRYLRSLAKLGYLEQDAARKYRLDLGVAELGLAAWNAMGLPAHVDPYMARLARRTGRVVHLAVLDGCDSAIVHCVGPDRERRGEHRKPERALPCRRPAHCTSAGKALLASLPVAQLERLLAQTKLERHAPKTITDASTLTAELRQVRLEALASAEDELAEGVCGIAAPVRIGEDEAIAAIGIASLPAGSRSERLDRCSADELVERFGGLLIGTAALVSRRLGSPDPT